MRAISIRQPWAWLVANGFKDIENRSWPTRFRGKVLIHASKKLTRDEYEVALQICELSSAITGVKIDVPAFEDLERGGIVGEAEITGCVTKHPSPWFFGDYGFVIENAKPLPFRQYNGALGFFQVKGGGQ